MMSKVFVGSVHVFENAVDHVRRGTEPGERKGGARWPLHYGTKPGHFETSKIDFPTSEGVSEVSE